MLVAAPSSAARSTAFLPEWFSSGPVHLCGYLKANTQYDSLFYNNLFTDSSTGMFHAEMDGSQTSLQMRSITDIYGTSFVWDEQASSLLPVL